MIERPDVTDTEIPADPAQDPPPYDPAIHTVDEDPLVSLHMWCACGAEHHQIDQVHHVRGPAETWQTLHVGDGHGPVPAAQAVEERNTRRWASLRAMGRQAEHEDRPAPANPAAAFDWTKGASA